MLSWASSLFIDFAPYSLSLCKIITGRCIVSDEDSCQLTSQWASRVVDPTLPPGDILHLLLRLHVWVVLRGRREGLPPCSSRWAGR